MLNIPELTGQLSLHGFKLTNQVKSLVYEGIIKCKNIDIPIQVVVDPNLIYLPQIILQERPVNLPSVCAHIGADNKVCYAQQGFAFIDRYSPVSSVLQCINLAADLVQNLMSGDSTSDTEDEFEYYWNGSPLLVDLNIINSGINNVVAIKIKYGDKNLFLLCPSIEYAKNKYELRLQTDEIYQPLIFFIDAKSPPKVSSVNWPILNLNDFSRWVKEYDNSIYTQFRTALIDWSSTKSNYMFLLIRHDVAWYGVGFKRPVMRKYKYGSEFLNAILSKHSKAIKIDKYQPLRVDEKYIVERNNLGGDKTLKGKNILLIGCGAIGGFLASYLVRAGAGHFDGCLYLIDDDILTPGNLGRHYLGFYDLLNSKVESIAKRLKYEHPGVNVEPLIMKGEDFNNFNEMDLIIDATGVEGFSNWLNEQFLNIAGFPPVIYSWVVGNGIAAQSFLQNSRAEACYKCLNLSDQNSPQSLLKKGLSTEITVTAGCDSTFVPYSQNAVTHAASLTSQHVYELCNENITDRLKSVVLNFSKAKTPPKNDPSKLRYCPACSH